jgi:hypothetical protein
MVIIIVTAVNVARMIILVYSAMKINANKPALNSILNPETSSDSPSGKSIGARFISAIIEINQINNRGYRIIRGGVSFVNILFMLNVINNEAIVTIIKIKLTSYEIVCATPRTAPSKAYFEFDVQPVRSTGYTFILIMQINIISLS